MMPRSLLAGLLVALALLGCFIAPATVRADGIDVDDPDVTVLTTDNFDAFIQNDLALVEFYAPWCGHCKSLAPEYAKAATTLLKDGIKLGKVDATVHSSLSGPYNVQGYPTLKVFRNGVASDYNGPRKADGIVKYMRKQTGPAAKTVTTDAELQQLFTADPLVGYVIVGFFNADKATQLQSSFGLVAGRMRDEFAFARTTDPTLKAAYGVPDGSEQILAFLHGEKTVYDGTSKTADLEAFIRANALPLVGEYSEATETIFRARNLPIAKLFVNVDRTPKSKTMTYYKNRLKKIAKQFEGKILVAYADRVGQKSQLDYLNAADEENVFVIDDFTKNALYRYEPDEDAPAVKGLDVAGWTRHVEEFLNGDAEKYIRSQRAPKGNMKKPVKIVTGNNFDDIVTKDRDVLIEFYAPWCGHCKALEPKYDQLGAKIAALGDAGKDIMIAKLDATANEYDREAWPVSGYPTIFFKPAGSEKGEVYSGPREVDDMYAHVMKHAKTAPDAKKSGKKKRKAKKKQRKEDDDDDEHDEL